MYSDAESRCPYPFAVAFGRGWPAAVLSCALRLPRRVTLAVGMALCLLPAACTEEREHASLPPAYESDVAPLLDHRCAECHSADAGDVGPVNRLDSYLDVLRCAGDPTDGGVDEQAGSALLHALSQPDHVGVASAAQRRVLEEFVDAGAPLRHAGVHRPGILNPHSTDWHGRLAAQDHFVRITSASHPAACGRCHDGAPVRPNDVRRPAPGATDCATCHQAEHGVLACGTCHGDGADRAYPPRDPCWFPSAGADAHKAHVEGDPQLQRPLLCTSCHPAADVTLSGTHADGRVDVAFDTALAGPDAQYDRELHQCTVRCHDRGGARPTPKFTDTTPVGCGDCHAAPPANHYAGTCDTCHSEVSTDGTALHAHTLHLNGRIDLGDGSGRCSACHGRGDDPAPASGLHALHMGSQITQGIMCGDCHPVPEEVTSPGHLDVGDKTPADIKFGSRARERDQAPTYSDGACRQIACHGAGLPGNTELALRWDAQPSGECSSCHGLPPSVQHPQDTTCSALQCHGAEVSAGTSALGITPSGRALHINGTYDTVPRK